MNWVLLSLGILMILFMAWVIISGRKECDRISTKKKKR